jgi:hypothetical protein
MGRKPNLRNGKISAAKGSRPIVLTGGRTVTFGALTETITGIFLDDDGTTEGDDLGIRVLNDLAYGTGESVTWSGSGTINLDITAFVEGTFQMDFGNLWLLDQNFPSPPDLLSSDSPSLVSRHAEGELSER